MPLETERGFVVVISIAQKAFLCMLAERGRTQTLNMSVIKPNAVQGLEDLKMKGLITITNLVGRTDKEFTLTELGVQVVDQVYASQKQTQEMQQFVDKVVTTEFGECPVCGVPTWGDYDAEKHDELAHRANSDYTGA